MTSETDEQFVERIGLDFDLSNTADIQRLFALARRGAAVQWKPIEEAPRLSRHEILLWDGARRFLGWWKSGAFWREDGNPFDATHWMPLPTTTSRRAER